MSREFKQFSEAGRLYAKYAAVVDEMYEAFKADISSFLDALRDEVGAELHVGELRENCTPAYRSWWIEDEDTKANDTVPYVYAQTRDARIIQPGVLGVTAAGDGLTDAHRAQIAALQTSLHLPDNCKVVKTGGIFSVLVSYDETDPVKTAAGPLRAILTALHDVEKRMVLKSKSAMRKREQ